MTALTPAAPLLWLLLIVGVTWLVRRAAAWLVAVEDSKRPVEPARPTVFLVRDGE